MTREYTPRQKKEQKEQAEEKKPAKVAEEEKKEVPKTEPFVEKKEPVIKDTATEKPANPNGKKLNETIKKILKE